MKIRVLHWVGFIYFFNTCVLKRITFACQSKKSITSTPVRKRQVNSPACSTRQQICSEVLEGLLNHLPCGIVEDKVGFVFANTVGQAIMFLHAKEN
jgi:hypothetical protein